MQAKESDQITKNQLTEKRKKDGASHKNFSGTIEDATRQTHGPDSVLRNQTDTPVSRIIKVDCIDEDIIKSNADNGKNQKKQQLDDNNLTPSSSQSSSQSNKSFRIKHEASPVKNLDPMDGAYTDQNNSNQIIDMFNRSKNASSQDRSGANQDNRQKLDPNKLAIPGKNNFDNQSVAQIMSFIQDKINIDIHKKITNVPEALPLIRRISHMNTQEDDLFKKVRVGQQNQNRSNLEENQNNCYHDEEIDDWKCKKCQNDISKFDIFFDDHGGQVTRFTEVLYENHFLSDFKSDFKSQVQMSGTQDKDAQQVLVYKQYQPSNTLELKEYNFMVMSKQIKKQNLNAGTDTSKMSPFGTGEYKNLSGKLLKYLIGHNERQKRLKTQYGNQILLFDSLFESGNLLQAERNALHKDTYNLFMQVDTNTRGHQQWFYFRVKGGIKDKTYTFQIMNFTKPGVTGGRGYKNGEHDMRIFCRSKTTSQQIKDFKTWESLTDCHYVKTGVARRKKDVIAAGADSDQEEWVERAFQQQAQSAVPGKPNDQQLPNITVNGQQEPSRNAVNPEGPTKVEKPKKRKVFYYYALQFQYTFKHDDDSVYFAFSQPVTYTDILNDLHSWEKKMQPKSQLNEKIDILKKQVKQSGSQKKIGNAKEEEKQFQKIPPKHRFKKEVVIESNVTNIYYRRVEFCRSISGLPLQKIIIARDYKSSLKNKTVLITSRVHSGETPGSQVFRGIYDFLTSDFREAKYLRRFYTFILIPVMNPDGVVCGNYRNSLAGVDLNRQWINPEKSFHPEVCAVKDLMQAIKEEDKRHIWIYCDLHGHSKKNNSFFYGCNTAANGGFLSWTIVRLLPRIFAQKTHMFNYKDCRFRVEPYKIGTARIVAWKQFQITHSFTLENSFYGYDLGEDESRAFTEDDYRTVGTKFILSIYEMHGMWKQIKRELNITHGWLKPRTLNDLTGVPAAQIIAEEAAKKKEEERKQRAILQYEEFLRKFYKEKKPITRHFQAYKEQNHGMQYQTPGNNMNKKMAITTKNKMMGQKLDDVHDLVDDMDSFTKPYPQKQKRAESANNNDLNCVQDPGSPSFYPVTAKLPQMTPFEEEVSEKEFMFKMHQGLVKIQALIRGFLARKQVAKLREKSSSNKKRSSYMNNFRSRQESGSNSMKRQRSNHVLANSSKKIKYSKANLPSQANLQAETRTGQSGGTGGFETSSDGGVKGTATGTSKNDKLDSSNDDQLMRAYTEQIPQNFSDSSITKISIESTGNMTGSKSGIFGQLRKDPIRLEWRNFFEEDELKRAYQIVEVEQRDETDNECSNESMGSNSDPSEDNFDEDEVYRKVYKVDNPEEIIEAKKQKEQEFIEKVQAEQISQEALLNQLKSEFKALNDMKDMEDGRTEDNDMNANESKKNIDGESQKLDNEESNRNNQPDESNKTTPFSKNHNDLDIFSNHALAPKTSNKLSIKQSPSNMNESQQDNLFQESQNNRRMIKTSAQQRAFTQQSHNNLTRVNFNQHSRLVQQSYYKIQQSLHGKKPNMNQVIKDCFIIKRMGSNNPVHSSHNVNSSSKLKHLQGSMQNIQILSGPGQQTAGAPHLHQTMNQNLQIMTPGAKYSSSSKKSGAYAHQMNQNVKIGQMSKQYQTHGVIMSNVNDKMVRVNIAPNNKVQLGQVNMQQMQADAQGQRSYKDQRGNIIHDPHQASQNSGAGASNSIHSYQLRMHHPPGANDSKGHKLMELTKTSPSFANPKILSDHEPYKHDPNASHYSHGQSSLFVGLQQTQVPPHHHSAQKRLNSQSHEQQQYNQLVQSQLNHMQQLSTNSKGYAKFNKTSAGGSDSKNNTVQFVTSHLGQNKLEDVQWHIQDSGPINFARAAKSGKLVAQESQSRSPHLSQGLQHHGIGHHLSQQNVGSGNVNNLMRAQAIEKNFLETNQKLVNSQHHMNNRQQLKQSQRNHGGGLSHFNPTSMERSSNQRRLIHGHEAQIQIGQNGLITLASTGHHALNEQQAAQLVNQLNQYMKNMTPAQAMEFLKMIQDKNIYLATTTPQSGSHIPSGSSSLNEHPQNNNYVVNPIGSLNNSMVNPPQSSNHLQVPQSKIQTMQQQYQQHKSTFTTSMLHNPQQQSIPIRQDWQAPEKLQRAATMQHRTPNMKPSTISIPMSMPQLLETGSHPNSSLPTNIQKFNKANQGLTHGTNINKSLNRTFYNQQSSTSQLQQISHDQQMAQSTINSNNLKKVNKKEASSIQQNNSSEYDLGASLFTKYVKKKASLQQANSYQQFW